MMDLCRSFRAHTPPPPAKAIFVYYIPRLDMHEKVDDKIDHKTLR